MKIKLEKISVQTKKTEELITITNEVERIIKESDVQNGIVNIMSPHTTAGIIVNECVECVQEDVLSILDKLAPKDGGHRHARYLDRWGGSAANAETHLKNMLAGINASFPIENGKLVKGGLQAIYFIEFDGPALRTYIVQVMGE